MVTFEKEGSCVANEPLALTLRCFYNAITIPVEKFYLFQ